eukprot:Amastigsp_a756_682.p3 type:complete len:136 gc:universal Amastigsp_a756_682:1357-1764(+)
MATSAHTTRGAAASPARSASLIDELSGMFCERFSGEPSPRRPEPLRPSERPSPRFESTRRRFASAGPPPPSEALRPEAEPPRSMAPDAPSDPPPILTDATRESEAECETSLYTSEAKRTPTIIGEPTLAPIISCS